MNLTPHWKRSEDPSWEFADPLRCNIWNLVIPALASVAGGVLASAGSSAAGNAQADAAREATALQREVYHDQRRINRPGYVTGGEAANLLGAQYGIAPQRYDAAYDYQPPPGSNQSPTNGLLSSVLAKKLGVSTPGTQTQPFDINDYEERVDAAIAGPATGSGTNGLVDPMARFMESPDAQIAVQGFRNVDIPGINGAYSPRGKVFSGARQRALDEVGAGRLGAAYGSYTNGLRSLAGMNQTATGAVTNAGANFATNAGANTNAAGTARANGLLGAYRGLGNGVAGALDEVTRFGQNNWGWT